MKAILQRGTGLPRLTRETESKSVPLEEPGTNLRTALQHHQQVELHRRQLNEIAIVSVSNRGFSSAADLTT